MLSVALFRDLRRTSLALPGNVAKLEKELVMVIERFLLLLSLIYQGPGLSLLYGSVHWYCLVRSYVIFSRP